MKGRGSRAGVTPQGGCWLLWHPAASVMLPGRTAPRALDVHRRTDDHDLISRIHECQHCCFVSGSAAGASVSQFLNLLLRARRGRPAASDQLRCQQWFLRA